MERRFLSKVEADQGVGQRTGASAPPRNLGLEIFLARAALVCRMLHKLIYLLSGAIIIASLGRWSKQSRTTVLILCSLWGGFISSLH